MSDWEIFLGGTWQRLGVVEVQLLDQIEESGQTTGRAEFRGHEYEYDILNMTQTNIATGRTRNLRRAEQILSHPTEHREKRVDPVKVTLHVYHVGHSDGLLSIQTANGVLNIMGTGVYHGAIEIYDLEWSYGAIQKGTGVFWCEPKQCPMHDYKESIELGTVTHSRQKVDQMLCEMKVEWVGTDYDLFRKNCCHFSNSFATRLGVGPIPDWVMNLAEVGAKLEDIATKGGKLRYGSKFDLRCNSYHFGDVTRGIIAVGMETRGAAVSKTRIIDAVRALGKICSGVCSKAAPSKAS